MIPIGEETIFYPRDTLLGAGKKRGNHKQTVNIEVSSNDVVEFLPDLSRGQPERVCAQLA